MAGYNGTGPLGAGSRTGGGFGYCPPAYGPAYPVYGVGRGGYPRGGGRGRARGGGRGRDYGFPAYPAYGPASPPPPGGEIDFLRSQEQGLREELDSIRARIGELEKEAPE